MESLNAKSIMKNKLIKEMLVEEFKIEDYDIDDEKKQVLYPNVNKIQIIKQLYEDNIGDQYTITIERQHKKYKIRNQIKNLKEKNLKGEVNESEKIIYMEDPSYKKNNNEYYQPIYIPNWEEYDRIINKKENKIEYYEIDKSKIENKIENETKESSGYIPPDVKTNENVSVVVKEIPNYMTINEVKKNLREIFDKYGMIVNINVLSRFNEELKTNMPIGIAFIDFTNKDDVDNLLKSTERFRISNSILKLELSNGNKSK